MTTTHLPGIEDVPDDSARLAREMVAKLTALLALMPGNWYYETCLRGWLKELAKASEK